MSKYNVGDKVVVKSYERIKEIPHEERSGTLYFKDSTIPGFIEPMKSFCGKEVTIQACLGDRLYWIEEDRCSCAWHESFFEETTGEQSSVEVSGVVKESVERAISSEGVKYDQNKTRFDLIPPEALWALAELYTAGAKKYGDRNWEKGMKWGRVFAAMMRHAWKWWAGEEYDQEDGQHHLISVAWCAFALYTYFVRGLGEDDRTKVNFSTLDFAGYINSEGRNEEGK